MQVRVFAQVGFELGDEENGTRRVFASRKTYLVGEDDARVLSQREPPPCDFNSVVLEDDDTEADADELLIELRSTAVSTANQEG